MNSRTHEYFDQMRSTAYAFDEARTQRRREREGLVSAGNWDAVRAWDEREKNIPVPYTPGQCKALRAYRYSCQIGSVDLVWNDFLWEQEVPDFCRTLEDAGVTELVITNQSTALMRNIHEIEAEGWRLTGACVVRISENRYGEDTIGEYPGLRFEIRKEG